MNSDSPWSYHQNAIAVAITMAISAFPTRLRSSRRCAMRVIVASGSRGLRRRRALRGACSLTGAPPGRQWSAGAVGRTGAGLLGAGAQLGGARLRGPGLGLQLRLVVGAVGR